MCDEFLVTDVKSQIWTWRKLFEPDENYLDTTKIFWTQQKQFVPIQNHFGPIEGQGIKECYLHFDSKGKTIFSYISLPFLCSSRLLKLGKLAEYFLPSTGFDVITH